MKEYFKNNKHIFEATIQQTEYMDTIKIGGKTYNDCINISINKTNPIRAKIPHLQSEPECGFDSILEDKDTSDFIKASLQYVCIKYPSVRIFEFDDSSFIQNERSAAPSADMSKIECGTKRFNITPKMRRIQKPFSLAHLYLATHGETWYENRFGAKMINDKIYYLYRESVNKLYEKIDIEYDVFKGMNSINSIQDAILSKYYSNDKTWIEFFNSIPKNEKCTALYNWLPYFIDPFLEHTYIEKSWYIDIDSMPKTRMEIVKDTPKVGGSRKTRKTRRTPRGLLFTNIKLHGGGGNGHIFDEL